VTTRSGVRLIQCRKEDRRDVLAIRADRTAAPADDPTMLTVADDLDALFVRLPLCPLNMANKRSHFLARSDIAHPTLMKIPLRSGQCCPGYGPLDIAESKGWHGSPFER
jgi:hypothetical protein